jgi:polysaccharide biosynthesis/export protein PslD
MALIPLLAPRRAARAGVLAACAAALMSCASPAPPVMRVDAYARQSRVPPESALPYVLAPGDEIEINFFRTPELNERQIIRPDGAISLLGVDPPDPGEIQAADLTTSQLTDALAYAYRNELKDPTIAVAVRAFGSNVVYVTGEVNRPGAVPIAGDMTALQAILTAEGVKSSARPQEVLLIRPAGHGHAHWQLLDLGKAYGRGDLSDDVRLAPRDIVYVPRSHIGNADEFVDLYVRKLLPIQPGINIP